MLPGIRFALAAAIVLSTTAMASAATKSHKIAVHRSSARTQAIVPRAGRFSDLNSPEATGGGSLGYNRNLYLAE